MVTMYQNFHFVDQFERELTIPAIPTILQRRIGMELALKSSYFQFMKCIGSNVGHNGLNDCLPGLVYP